MTARPHVLITIYGVHLWAYCTCGWQGPRRCYGDPHHLGLVEDDKAWHLEAVAA